MTCVNEDQHVEEYLQFRVSAATPISFPNHYSVNGINFRIDHALPYAMPISSGVRPPTAQSVHEHWKLSVKKTSNDRKGHANTIEKVENCPGSQLRCLKLREVFAQDNCWKYSACFEKGHVPLCFFRKEVPTEVAVEHFANWCRSFKALDDHTLAAFDEPSSNSNDTYLGDDCQRLCVATVRCLTEQSLKVGLFIKAKYGWIVSTSERLQCYAYTACTIILVLPVGYKIEDICSPVEHLCIQKIFPLEGKQNSKDGDDKQLVNPASATVTPLGSNPLYLRGNSQLSDALHSQRCALSKSVEADCEMSPTLPWPNHDLKDKQVGNQPNGHPGDRIHKSLCPEAEDPKTVVINNGLCGYASEGHNGVGLDKEPGKDSQNISSQAQLNSKGCQLGLVNTHAELQVPLAPFAGQCSQLSPVSPDAQNALYAGDKLMPKLVTAESCFVEGFPDPRNSDNTELQQLFDPKLYSSVQEILPPGPISRSPPPRERKSRSVSVHKRGCVNKTRPASFARSVSPTISKVQAGQAKEKLKSCLQTTPHKQKSNIARNKNHVHLTQVDVSKPVATPVPPDVDMSPRKPGEKQVDADIVDLVKKFSKEEKEQEALMKNEINDAVHKWCSQYPAAHQERIAYVAFKFRCRISSTICFLFLLYEGTRSSDEE